MWTPWVAGLLLIYSSKITGAFVASKRLSDFSAYNTQVLCLTRAITRKGYYNDRYNYV
jgi:hypothetical protein